MKKKKKVLTFFLARRGLSNDDVGATWGTVLQEMRPGAGFKTGDVVTGKLGAGYRKTTRMFLLCFWEKKLLARGGLL